MARMTDSRTYWRMNDDLLKLDELDNYRQVYCEELYSHSFVSQLFSKCSMEAEYLKIIHLNIRSYYKNIDNFLILIDSLNIKLDIIILSEAWIDDDKTLTTLNDYDVYSTTNNWNRNDGVIVYINKELGGSTQQITLGEATGLRLDFDIDTRHYELLAIYRSPAMNCDLFMTDLKNYYSPTRTSNNTTYIFVGDINIDTLNTSSIEKEKDCYLNILYEAGLTECINKPTRVTEHSKTCIDHIFIKHHDYRAVTAGILITDVTDHYAVLAGVQLASSRAPSTATGTDSYLDHKLLHSLLETQSWDRVLAHQDANTCSETFMAILETLKEKSLKTKIQNTRLKKLKPWITVDLIKAIRKRDKLSKDLKRQPFNINLECYYKTFRNNLANEIKRVKYNYYKEQIADSSNNPKRFWGIINELSGVKRNKIEFPIQSFMQTADTGGGGVRAVANAFNVFFSQVGSRLAGELPRPTDPPLVDDAAYQTGHLFRFESVTDSQVESCVSGMRGGSAPGHDDIPSMLIKSNIKSLLVPLKHLINLSLSSGIFPENLKLAKVVPIFKSKSKSDMNNYRPISLLSVVAKVLERCVKKQFQNYLESNNVISENQFGFRQNRNTSDALFQISKIIMDPVNENNKTLLVFIDLAKAFDSLDRQVLFKKLQYMGVRGMALKWFQSYLTGRRQIVSINNSYSDHQDVNYGVVQGSTLGPLLFLIYINNLDKLSITGKLLLFADDTVVIFKHKTWREVYQLASLELSIIKNWFCENILTMNISKTKCLPIALRPSSEPPADLQLMLHTSRDRASTSHICQIIERVDNYKYLGVIIDNRLNWKPHITYLKLKLRKMIFVFYQLGQILNSNELKSVYFAYVQSILQYGIISWGGALKTTIEPLNVIQKSIIKAGFKKSRRYPSVLLFLESNLLTVRQLYIQTVLVYTYTHRDSVLTPITHGYGTRTAARVGLRVPVIEMAVNLTNAYYIANIIYRHLPSEIRDLRDEPVSGFKRLVSAWLRIIGPVNAESLLTPFYCN